MDVPGSRETGVHFNDTVVLGIWVKCVLHVTLSNDSNVSDDLDGRRSKHVVLVVGEGLGGCNDDGISGMCTQGIKVLHVATNDDILFSSVDIPMASDKSDNDSRLRHP
jgi:hypothetical protein